MISVVFWTGIVIESPVIKGELSETKLASLIDIESG